MSNKTVQNAINELKCLEENQDQTIDILSKLVYRLDHQEVVNKQVISASLKLALGWLGSKPDDKEETNSRPYYFRDINNKPNQIEEWEGLNIQVTNSMGELVGVFVYDSKKGYILINL
jgi:hypothetical protein